MPQPIALKRIWVPLTTYRWNGGGKDIWPVWLQTYSMNGFAPMIDRIAEPRLRVHNGYQFQFARIGDWILLDQGAAQVYTNDEFNRRFPNRKIMR